jgi:hypothetical protein
MSESIHSLPPLAGMNPNYSCPFVLGIYFDEASKRAYIFQK